jgi:hypothetical protein
VDALPEAVLVGAEVVPELLPPHAAKLKNRAITTKRMAVTLNVRFIFFLL